MSGYHQDREDELIHGLISGDRSAFESLYNLYASGLFDYAFKRIGDKAECENIIQEVFTSLWQRRNDLQITSLRHYLFNAVKYMVIRHFYLNRLKQNHAEHFKTFSEVYDSIGEDERDPDHIRETILRHLRGLPVRCEEAMTLRVIENMSYAEIARRMSISKKTVELYISKALAHLRERMKRGVDW